MVCAVTDCTVQMGQNGMNAQPKSSVGCVCACVYVCVCVCAMCCFGSAYASRQGRYGVGVSQTAVHKRGAFDNHYLDTSCIRSQPNGPQLLHH